MKIFTFFAFFCVFMFALRGLFLYNSRFTLMIVNLLKVISYCANAVFYSGVGNRGKVYICGS